MSPPETHRFPGSLPAILLSLGLGFAPAVAQQASPSPPTATPEAPAIDLASLLEDYRSVTPDREGTTVHARLARIGHLEIDFADGRLFPLRARSGESIGLFFVGDGRYTYRSEDPADRQVIETNVARETTARLYDQDAVRDTFKRAVLLFAAPIAGGPGPPAPPPLSEADAAAFREILARIDLTHVTYDHLAAEARLNGGDRQYVYVEMEGGRETIGYIFDRVAEYGEQLFLFRRLQGRKVRFVRPLSHQNVDGGPAAHSVPFTVKHARIEVSTADHRTGQVDSDLEIVAGPGGLHLLRFNLLNNRDPATPDWSSARNRLEVVRVTDAAGTPLPFSHRDHELLVMLPSPAAPGETLRLKVATRGEIFTDLRGEHADNYFELLSGSWFPRPATSVTSLFTFDLKVRTRKPFVPVATGGTVSFHEDGEFYELETRSNRPVDRIAVLGGVYRSREQTFGTRAVRVHAYATALQWALDEIPQVADKYLQFLEQTVGPYPFGDLDIVEAPGYADHFMAFGLAPPGLILITGEAYNSRRDTATSVMTRGVNHRLAHEIAHQWFPHQAMIATSRDTWLSESLAEYVSGLAIAFAAPDAREVEDFPRIFADWQFHARSCKDAGGLENANMLGGPDAWTLRECLLYSRGPLVLHMLRAMAGNDRFFAILRRYVQAAAGRTVTTDDFRRAAEEVLQVDLGWFFEDWVRKGGLPKIRVVQRVQAGPDGKAVLVGTATQPEGAAFRRIVIPLVLEFDDGRREVKLVYQDQPTEEFRFDLPAKPGKVRIDPAHNNLADYD